MKARRFFAAVGVAFALGVALPHSAHADSVGPSSAPKYAFVDASISANGCVAVATPNSGQRMRVWSVRINNKTATNASVSFWAQAQCATNQLSPSWKVNGNTTFDASGDSPYPQFVTTATSVAAYVKSTAATDLAVQIVYTEFDPSATQSACDWENGGVPEWSPSSCTSAVTVANTSSERVPVDLDASDVGSGGGGASCPEDTPCQVAIVDAGETVVGLRGEVVLAAGLLVFMVAVLAIRSYRRGRLPL